MYISSGAPNSVYSSHSNEPSFGFWQGRKSKNLFSWNHTKSTTNFDSTRSSQFAKVFSHGILLTILPARSSQSCGKAQCIGENRNFYRAHHMFFEFMIFFSPIFLSWKGNLIIQKGCFFSFENLRKSKSILLYNIWLIHIQKNCENMSWVRRMRIKYEKIDKKND